MLKLLWGNVTIESPSLIKHEYFNLPVRYIHRHTSWCVYKIDLVDIYITIDLNKKKPVKECFFWDIIKIARGESKAIRITDKNIIGDGAFTVSPYKRHIVIVYEIRNKKYSYNKGLPISEHI
jgi:hypothetical protein